MVDYKLLANTIRILSIDCIEKAQSGHPGMPMGMAEIGVVLWKNHLKHNPKNPAWFNRDRFVLSNGHGSMLAYCLLHLTGYALSIEDLKVFRQLDSKTPGHPEFTHTIGIETTTGPLGQGLANAVGMALSEKILASQFNREDFNIVDHYTYVFVGDGCLMEGISHEVCSLAGTLKLGKLIVFYDNNGISIDGEIENWFDENVSKRFDAYDWQVIQVNDGHNINLLDSAIVAAQADITRPTLIICNTIIGHGSPNKFGTAKIHGAPLGELEVSLVRNNLDWHYPPFIIPQQVYTQFACTESGLQLENVWNNLFAKYTEQYPKLASEFTRRMMHKIPFDWQTIITNGIADALNQAQDMSTRVASQKALQYYAKFLPELFGGSADLSESTLTHWNNAQTLTHKNNFTGNYLSYGVREFGMSAILNGIYLHGGLRPFGSTFLMFSEYARNAIRMASLMQIAPIFVYTHDSIGLGEDGPTHQPIEQLATLRLIPNMHVWRPCDSVETMCAWAAALSQKNTPSCLVFSRQTLKYIKRDHNTVNNIFRGGYILKHNNLKPIITIIATGSEVELALQVYEQFIGDNHKVALVSMPSTSIFDQQELSYKEYVIKPDTYKVVIEAGRSDIWHKYLNGHGLIIGIDTFGKSAPTKDLFRNFGFTVDSIVQKVYSKLNYNT
jgi:transketolase